MVCVKSDMMTNKAQVSVEGNLGQIYAEMALVVKMISDNKDLEMTPGDVLEMIGEAIEEGQIPEVVPKVNKLEDE